MDITYDKTSETSALLKVTLNQADYQPAVDKKIKTYSKQASFKGFRPGKVPPGLIRKMYGKGILVEEVTGLLNQSLSDYFKENELPMVGDPMPDEESGQKIDWENQKDFEFIYKIGLHSEFELNLEKVNLNQFKITITDKQLEETMEEFLKGSGTSETPETADKGDIIRGTVISLEDKKKLEEQDKQLQEGVELEEILNEEELKKQIFFNLDKVNARPVKKLIGLAVEDLVTINLQKLFKEKKDLGRAINLTEEDAEKLEGDFELKVETITRMIPAEQNQEFYDKAFGEDTVHNEDEFKVKVEEMVQENYSRESDAFLGRQIREKLLEDVEIDLPNDFLKEWLQFASEGKFTPEQVEEEYDKYAEELKWNIIRNRLAKENEIKVEYDEIFQEAKKQMAGYLGMSLENAPDYLNESIPKMLEMENGRFYNETANQLIYNKVITLAKDKVKLKEKSITRDKFEKMLEDEAKKAEK